MEKTEIHIIDDDLGIFDLLKDFFEDTSYFLSASEIPQKGIDYVKFHPVGLVILDLMLPGMDGFEVCKKLRENDPDLPIIMLTAKKSDFDRIVGLELGADDYMSKPFHPRELLARIKTILRRVEGTTANKELESFSYSISHDLRAPLRAINGFSNILLEDYSEKLDKEGQRLFNIIRDNAKKMGTLIDDLLAFSRITKHELKKSEIDMKVLVNAIYHEITSEQDREKISFSVADLPKAKGDTAMIKQLWINLISNAVKFTSKKEKPTIEIAFKFEEGNNIYFIKDNGAGFDMNYYDKLFGVFQRLHHESEYQGTGVGLAIVKSIVTKHGGKIWAESELNVVTTFYFYLE